jgi:hypothetical protein
MDEEAAAGWLRERRRTRAAGGSIKDDRNIEALLIKQSW